MKKYLKYIIIFIILVIIAIIMFPAILITAILTPSVDKVEVSDYKKLEKVNLDWGEILTYDVVVNDNNPKKLNANKAGFEFLIVSYKKYDHEKIEEKDDNGNITHEDTLVLVEENKYSGKTQINKLLKKLGHKNQNSVVKAVKILEEKNKSDEYEITISYKDIHDLIKNLDEEQQEYAEFLLSDNAVYEMYQEQFDLPENIPVLSDSFFAWPVPSLQKITSPFGWRNHPTKHKRLFHYGIDISGPSAEGQPIIASADGKVFQVNYGNGEAGYNVRIRHYDKEENEWQTKYCHMSTITVKAGEKVKQGDVIGAVGNTGVSTGPHLHFELKFNGMYVDPYNFIK